MFWRLFWSLVYKKHKIFRCIIYEQENNVNVVFSTFDFGKSTFTNSSAFFFDILEALPSTFTSIYLIFYGIIRF